MALYVYTSFMLEFFVSPLTKAFAKVRANPQLLYTILVALVIVGAFIFMAERFIGIATDAQDRLVNVRVGALQDAFVPFAAEHLDDSAYLNEKIRDLVAANPTIQDFRIVKRDEAPSGAESPYIVIASGALTAVGTRDANAEFLYTLAAGDPSHSVTLATEAAGTRIFKTARAIENASSSVVAVAMTTQTLSEADRAIQRSIQGSLFLLVGVLIVIMLLFVRFSKVIDYMSLYKQLKGVDQLKDDFISMASHELRTPLTVIRGYADYIKGAKELSEETRAYVAKIDVSAKGLDDLVEDILNVSRMEQGRMTFSLAPVSPAPLIVEVAASFELPAKEKGLAIAVDTAQVPLETHITVDKDRLRQVLVNLIGNAVKYTKQGSVTVREYLEKGRLVIRVSDTGLGMTAEEREHLFEKFYRVRNDDTKDIRGTGLGLWITAQIVRQMKGTISVESIKGVGSHFIISFPAVG